MSRGPLTMRVMKPATRLDAWRLRHLPRWLIALWPVRYVEVEVLTLAGVLDKMRRSWSAERLEQLRAMERR